MEEFTGENADLNAVKARAQQGVVPLDMNFEFTPNNPYSLTIDTKSLGQSQIIPNKGYQPTYFETVGAELREFNASATFLQAADNKLSDPSPFEDIPPPNWNPKSDPAKYLDIDPKYYPYLFDAKGPKALDYRIQRAREEQKHDETLANGSFTARVLGGLAGIATDPVSYIPIVGWAKYAKFAPTIFKTAARALPGVASTAIIQSAAKQVDLINGNMEDFLVDSAVNTVFGVALFGGLGAAGLSVEKMNLWNLRKFANAEIDGAGFKMAVDEEGRITGFQAFDKTGGNLSAAKVTYYQDLANSQFEKSGVFKVPYLGEGLYRFLTMPVLGTPLPKLLNSKYANLRGFVDRAVDHNIITKALANGETSPVKFTTLMNQTFAGLRALDAQMVSLHLERNGLDIKNRAAQGIVGAGLNVRQKGLEALGRDLDKSEYISKNDFYSEIEDVLIRKQPSNHATVNEAAAMMRKTIDDTYRQYRKAYNLPEDWMPPDALEGYLMRVYDTPYMNVNEAEWINSISGWLQKSDELITSRMKPIKDLENQIALQKNNHEELIRKTDVTKDEIKSSLKQLEAHKINKAALEEALQDELKTNKDLHYHIEDYTALSASEVKELKALTKRVDIAQKEIDAQKKFIRDMKERISKSKSTAMKGKTPETSKKHLRRSDIGELSLDKEEVKLKELEDEKLEEELKIQQAIAEGKVNPRLYYKPKDTQVYVLKDSKETLKFREVYATHRDREVHAKSAYDTIMNQTNEHTISQVLGKLSGNEKENHLKSRTLLIPDSVLYENKFMSPDLMAKVANYVNALSRRTHLKNVFKDVTVDHGIEDIIQGLNDEYAGFKAPLLKEKALLKSKLETAESEELKKELQTKITKVEKQISRETKEFDKAKKSMNHIYEKMMGIKKIDSGARKIQSAIMSFTAMASLGLLPVTMINDLSVNCLQHGIWPFIRDGVYPVVHSLFGLLKTQDSEALRKTAPSIDLALQDVMTGYADKNWGMYTEPYANLGKWVGGLEKMAHFSSNASLTTYFDNGLQRIAGSIVQSEFMRILHAFKAGTMTEKESLYLRKYGIDPKLWADRMIAAFKADGGGKTAIGGYKANFWHWQDMEAANAFSTAVFRGVESTTIKRGLADSPFWADNVIGSIIHGFSGWMYASVNRYLIPTMQAPDLQKLMGVMFMLGTGYLVSPLRRLAKGDEPFPENQTDAQRLYETVQDSGFFSYFMTVLSDANLLTGDRLLGDLKNDKYRDRSRIGLLGPSVGKINQLFDVITAISSNQMNQADAKKMFRMIPIMNASWASAMSAQLAEHMFKAKNRTEAKAMNG